MDRENKALMKVDGANKGLSGLIVQTKELALNVPKSRRRSMWLRDWPSRRWLRVALQLVADWVHDASKNNRRSLWLRPAGFFFYSFSLTNLDNSLTFGSR
jgi:hypothetical protein